ncbi:hypothetical protein POTOM_043318 [Populus tomentosa]|uniref:Uncharacterized protein n=1 Tax=Populus tomentosa TaxID=118781 RepID=A0A8X7YPC9_POPTO|nr:hypothetical protein POTOM_043318 [Populus tomentosa]
MRVFLNFQVAFSAKNIESICSVGNSTKKGNRKRGYIGEKEKLRRIIVPEWVEENPSLPTTVVLLLKPDKVNPVKKQLSSIHPEVFFFFFLSKIKSLSVREDNENPELNTVGEIAITTETNFRTRKSMDAESYTLRLSMAENSTDELDRECSYYVWIQKFAVKQENKVEKRMEVEDWVMSLAFPNGERLRRGMSSPWNLSISSYRNGRKFPLHNSSRFYSGIIQGNNPFG